MFKPVRGFEDRYLVDEMGTIKDINGGTVKQYNTSTSGYLSVGLRSAGKRKTVFKMVHRLVAETFLPNPEGKPQVNHKNGIKTDNRLENLAWVTASENVQHCYDSGLKKYKPLHYKGKFGKDHNRSKAVFCVTNGRVYGSIAEAARELKVHISSIAKAVKDSRPLKKYNLHFEYLKLV